MSFLAALIIGTVTYFTLPVSLLPDIDIPQITIQISGEATGARELENTVTAPLRRQLLQVGGLQSVRSETRDGVGIIRLQFEYGVNTDLAFIEVNEKIDAAMNSFPASTPRPKAIKASATDIPVLYLNMTLRDRENGNFLELTNLAENIVRRRIEQLPEVAMADITGIPGQQLRITPDPKFMEASSISVADIEKALQDNNAEPGSMTVRDGIYEYNINISNQLRTPDDVKRIFIRKGERILQLGDFCGIEIVADNPKGYNFFNSDRAVTLAIIKQGEENIGNLKDALGKTIDYFEKTYPQIRFTESRNQTELLDFTISNLVQNLILGFILVFLLTAIFMGNTRASLVIGISIAVSVIITFLIFFIFKVSINIISLSGLILAVGMMIDNSVIVTENITQFRQRGLPLKEACDAGTSEMITPMLSSSLTTVAVFIPLVFMSGIAGAIFFDQAFAITAGLAVSYIVGIMLLPVLYMLIFSIGSKRENRKGDSGIRWLEKLNTGMTDLYTTVYAFCFRHKWICLALTGLTIPLCVILFEEIPVERMPELDHDDVIARVEWNENISIAENSDRVNSMVATLDTALMEAHSAYIGIQDYLLDTGSELSPSEAEIYLKATDPQALAILSESLVSSIRQRYPKSTVELIPSENIFEKVFSSDEPDLEVRLTPKEKSAAYDLDNLMNLEKRIGATPTPLRDRVNLVIDRERLQIYKVGYSDVARALRTAFKANSAGILRSYEQYLPITISGEEKNVGEVLSQTLVKGIPLSALVTAVRDRDLKSITAGSDGEYIPLPFHGISDPAPKMAEVREATDANRRWEASFSGALFSNREMIRELTVILGISLLMMYFILCSQFGNFIQPLVVLVEIPLDTAFALITLWICGESLNLMSAIGIIVTCGIVVNDSILKLDAINELRKEGMPLEEAIHTAGVRRLRPIIMTSLTTILAMVPILFTSDLGSELQRPLAITMIGSMTVGTLVSIFIIPILYWLIYRNEKTTSPA